ncbi:MAG: T9SS type A sorting domain-containing protein [Bacteroidales bacterium]|nr:T9SS type A sorting domain-containing protein [Bacteroidales bacterium]
MKKLLAIVFILLTYTQVFGVKSWEMKLTNFVQEDERGFTFDILLRNTNVSEPFALSGVQWQVTFNTAIKNGGDFQNTQCTYVLGSSELQGTRMIPITAYFTQIYSGTTFQWVTQSLGLEEMTTYFDHGDFRRIGTFRVRLRTASTGTTVHNFHDDFVNMSLKSTGCLLTECEVYYDEEGADGAGYYRASAPFNQIVSNTLTNDISNSTMVAGHYLGVGTDWATSNNWNTLIPSSNPDYHQIPNSTQNALVGVNAVIASTTDAQVNNLILKTGATLTIQSNASGNGSLIVSNSIVNNGTIIVEHYLPGSAQSWHFISSPMASGTISGNGWSPTPGQDDFYAWDEPSPGTWVNYLNTTTSPTFTTVNGSADGLFMPGKGYLVAYNAASPTKNFTAGPGLTPTIGNLNFSLSYTNSGWNLLGNPYTSGIDWNQADRSKFVDDYAYIYDPNKPGGEGYMIVDGGEADAFIGSGQGFFVLAEPASNGQNFQFTSAMQAHGGTSYKSPENESYISLRLSGGEYFDETTLRFREGATAARERDDALKLYSFNTAIPQLYSFSTENYELSVNTVPNETPEGPMALGVKIPANGTFEFSLNAETMDLFPSGVYLEDTEADVIHNLTNGSYSFESEGGTFTNRFKLYFSFTGLPELPASSSIQAWVNHNVLYIENLKDASTLSVVSLSGATLIGKEIPAGTTNWHATINLKSGVYVIQIKNDKETKTFKAFIQ